MDAKEAAREPSRSFQNFRLWKVEFRSKYPIPESIRDAKTVLIVSEMMLEVILFELTIVRGKTILVSGHSVVYKNDTYLR
jgi:hypothetical protein